MIITKTCLRCSFCGGGSDVPTFYQKHGGLVVGGAISKYSYFMVRKLPPFFDYKTRLVYSEIEHVKSVEDIKHNAIRNTITFLKLDSDLDDGLEIHHCSDLPSRTGTGSSSSFIVGLVHALSALKGSPDSFSPAYLKNSALHIEQQMCGETTGDQDAIWAAYGGLNVIQFYKNGDIKVEPLPISYSQVKDLEDHLMLFFTGFTRTSSEIASSYYHKLPDSKEHIKLVNLAEESIQAITAGRYDRFGKIVHDSWMIKRNISDKVSNSAIDNIYRHALDNGAWGGKIMGAGGGGCMMLVVPPERKNQIRKALPDLLEINFNFDFGGSRVIMCNND